MSEEPSIAIGIATGRNLIYSYPESNPEPPFRLIATCLSLPLPSKSKLSPKTVAHYNLIIDYGCSADTVYQFVKRSRLTVQGTLVSCSESAQPIHGMGQVIAESEEGGRATQLN